MTLEATPDRGEHHPKLHEVMHTISHPHLPHLPEHEPHPVSLHREPPYLETARMSREMTHL